MGETMEHAKKICTLCGREVLADNDACPSCGNVFRKEGEDWDWWVVTKAAMMTNDDREVNAVTPIEDHAPPRLRHPSQMVFQRSRFLLEPSSPFLEDFCGQSARDPSRITIWSNSDRVLATGRENGDAMTLEGTESVIWPSDGVRAFPYSPTR